MSNEMAAGGERPRWATYSVKSHQNLERLICDLMLFDVLVFPCPAEEPGEYDLWIQEKWDPDLLKQRLDELRDLAVATPWDPTLRDVWRNHWYDLPAEERHGRQIAFQSTAAILAAQSLTTLLGEDDPRLGPAARDHPRIHSAFGSSTSERVRTQEVELVAAFQTTDDGAALTGTHGLPTIEPRQELPHEGWQDGIRVRWQLPSPAEATEDTWRRVIELVHNDSFREARHRLWTWEAQLLPTNYPEDIRRGLEQLVADYDAAVRRQKISTISTWAYLVVPAVVDAALGGGWTGMGGGVASTVALDAVRARFPALSGSAERASHLPGSAVSGLLAIAGPAVAPRSIP